MRSPCRTKELQLTDCQAQHCRAKREPQTDYNMAFVQPGGEAVRSTRLRARRRSVQCEAAAHRAC